jgi:replicative DNA helicase
MAKIVDISEVQDQIFHLHKYGQQRGHLVGFPSLDKLYSIKPGTSTIIYGYPTSGKSQFLIQTLCALATKHNKKCLIYTPETGSAHAGHEEKRRWRHAGRQRR